jgi:hypothetical protein
MTQRCAGRDDIRVTSADPLKWRYSGHGGTNGYSITGLARVSSIGRISRLSALAGLELVLGQRISS